MVIQKADKSNRLYSGLTSKLQPRCWKGSVFMQWRFCSFIVYWGWNSQLITLPLRQHHGCCRGWGKGGAAGGGGPSSRWSAIRTQAWHSGWGWRESSGRVHCSKACSVCTMRAASPVSGSGFETDEGYADTQQSDWPFIYTEGTERWETPFMLSIAGDDLEH